MQLVDILAYFVTILVTVVVTIAVNKQAIKKKMAAYLDFISPLFNHVGPDVREDLEIQYRGMDVSELTQFRMVVVNEGQQAVGDYESPLTLHLHGDPLLLSIDVAEKHPDELDVDLYEIESGENDDSRQIEIRYPFLNGGDWFVLTGLVEGHLSPRSLELSIREKNLPTEVPVKPSFSYSPPGLRPKVIPWTAFLGGVGAASWFWTLPVEEWLQTTVGLPLGLAVAIRLFGVFTVLGFTAMILSALLEKVWPSDQEPPPFTSTGGPREDSRPDHLVTYIRGTPDPEDFIIRKRSS